MVKSYNGKILLDYFTAQHYNKIINMKGGCDPMIFTIIFRDCAEDTIGTIMEKCAPCLVREDFRNIKSTLEFECYMTGFEHPIEAYIFGTDFRSTMDMIMENRMWAAADHVWRYTPEEVFNSDDLTYSVYGHIYADGVEIRTTGNLRGADNGSIEVLC